MGLFKKKTDPISDRAKALNDQIARLEAEIKRLSEAPPPEEAPTAPAPAAAQGKSAPVPASSSPFAAKAAASTSPAARAGPQPRIRSTTVPYSHAAQSAAIEPPAPAKSPEPVFENVDQHRIKEQPEAVTTETHYNELGVRKYDLPALWRRFRNHFRGPATTNPKLVNYLAAGSIQGLRPLRYEKRVARNRFIFLVVILIVVLWGIIAFFIKRN